jgi:hypothetical protein
MRPSECNWEHVKSLKRGENRRAQTGQVGLANRRLPVWMQARRFASSLNSRAKIAANQKRIRSEMSSGTKEFPCFVYYTVVDTDKE